MDLKDAIQLITHNDFSTKDKRIWADLGCGSGTFTLALANILDDESTIYALDSNAVALSTIPAKYKQVAIKTIITDFIRDDLQFEKLDGILMANSLHFVKEKEAFLTRLKSYLKDDASLLIIEYDSKAANTWVPYPIDFQSLRTLFARIGYMNISKLNTRASVYGNTQMYAALIKP